MAARYVLLLLLELAVSRPRLCAAADLLELAERRFSRALISSALLRRWVSSRSIPNTVHSLRWCGPFNVKSREGILLDRIVDAGTHPCGDIPLADLAQNVCVAAAEPVFTHERCAPHRTNMVFARFASLKLPFARREQLSRGRSSRGDHSADKIVAEPPLGTGFTWRTQRAFLQAVGCGMRRRISWRQPVSKRSPCRSEHAAVRTRIPFPPEEHAGFASCRCYGIPLAFVNLGPHVFLIGRTSEIDATMA